MSRADEDDSGQMSPDRWSYVPEGDGQQTETYKFPRWEAVCYFYLTHTEGWEALSCASTE